MDVFLLIQDWFRKHQRKLPWREDKTPYRVWISEIMLQQTQVDVVIPYFNRWIKHFPTVEDLAQSSEDQVVKLWEGLGYYSRARNLLKGAKFVVEQWQGQFPSDSKELKKIPGVGPYTVGAIRAFAFGEKAAAVDGNVIRVMSRLWGIEEEITEGKDKELLGQSIEEKMPSKEPALVTEGLIEFGALICKKKPLCSVCPLIKHCIAYQKDIQESLPIKRVKRAVENLKRFVAVIEAEGFVLVRKVPKGEVMAGLYEFPYHDTEEKLYSEWKEYCSMEQEVLPTVKHGFTHHRVTLYPKVYAGKLLKVGFSWEWVKKEQLSELPFSSGHRRILASFSNL